MELAQYRAECNGGFRACRSVVHRGVGEHAAEYLFSGVCARLIAQLAGPPHPRLGGPFEDRLLVLGEAAV